ncbi:hypothetical protein [Zavarzinia compransoris]|uniref:hypothetical protein n=1 Tax=Zavarzinia compransoris TaxID=1264899 RepID=UPI00105FDF7C|nr:hypothetical protein [Zavarzinia compransoris]
MNGRVIRHEEAAAMLGEYVQRRIWPLLDRMNVELDMTLELAVDGLCATLADDLEADIAWVPEKLLRSFCTRVGFFMAAISPDQVIGTLPAGSTDEYVLRAVLGTQVRQTRIPLPEPPSSPRETH